MAKTIKFNLICDGYPVRTVEDLQNHFSVEDVLDYYQNGLLQRWLRVRGYERELMDVSDITSKEPMEIVKQLIRIFDVAADEEVVEEEIYMLQFLRERDARLARYEQRSYHAGSILQGYSDRYNQLINTIRANPTNSSLIKACLKEISMDFSWIFRLDHRRFFYAALYDQSPLIIMCLLMSEGFRRYYLPEEVSGEQDKGEANTGVGSAITGGDANIANMHTILSSVLTAPSVIANFESTAKSETDNPGSQAEVNTCKDNSDRNEMYKTICSMLQDSRWVDGLGDSLRVYAGSTKEYWKDLEPKGKKYMILKMEPRNFIRSAGVDGQELSDTDINFKFPILDGIDYKSNYPDDRLLYMEV